MRHFASVLFDAEKEYRRLMELFFLEEEPTEETIKNSIIASKRKCIKVIKLFYEKIKYRARKSIYNKVKETEIEIIRRW